MMDSGLLECRTVSVVYQTLRDCSAVILDSLTLEDDSITVPWNVSNH